MPEVGWVDRSIGDCLNTSFAGEWGSEPAPGNAIVLRATDIDNDGHVVGAGAIRSIPNSKLCAKRLHQGDILLEGSGGGPDKPVGRVALFDASAHSSPAVCSNFFKTLRPAPHVVHDRFLWRKLGWFYRQPALLALQQQTTGIINLKFAEYLCVRISLPVDVAEQVKIAEVLDTLDTTIRQTEAIIDKLKQVKQGLLHDLLTRGIADNGELRPPQSEAPHLYKESALGWIPSTWNARPLRDFGAFMNGLNKPKQAFGHGTKFVNISDVYADYMDTSSLGRVEATAGELVRYQLAPGDIVLDRSSVKLAGVGYPSVFEGDIEQVVFCGFIIRLRLTDATATIPRYLCLQMRAARFRNEVFKVATGGANININQASLNQLVAVMPVPAEQRGFIELERSADDRLQSESALHAKLLRQKAGLMDDLLTGRVRVTPLLLGAPA